MSRLKVDICQLSQAGEPPKRLASELIKKLSDTYQICTNGTAVEGVCVTRRNPPVDCPGCEHGVVPVGRRVWRGICKAGCGWFCDRGIGPVSYTHLRAHETKANLVC